MCISLQLRYQDGRNQPSLKSLCPQRYRSSAPKQRVIGLSTMIWAEMYIIPAPLRKGAKSRTTLKKNVCTYRYRSPAPKERANAFNNIFFVRTYTTSAPKERSSDENAKVKKKVLMKTVMNAMMIREMWSLRFKNDSLWIMVMQRMALRRGAQGR